MSDGCTGPDSFPRASTNVTLSGTGLECWLRRDRVTVGMNPPAQGRPRTECASRIPHSRSLSSRHSSVSRGGCSPPEQCPKQSTCRDAQYATLRSQYCRACEVGLDGTVDVINEELRSLLFGLYLAEPLSAPGAASDGVLSRSLSVHRRSHHLCSTGRGTRRPEHDDLRQPNENG